jgi:hypothetical protein
MAAHSRGSNVTTGAVGIEPARQWSASSAQWNRQGQHPPFGAPMNRAAFVE